jgi:hypothetical protein
VNYRTICDLVNCKLKKKSTRNCSIDNVVNINLGCLHPVARVISYDMGFNPSTQL